MYIYIYVIYIVYIYIVYIYVYLLYIYIVYIYILYIYIVYIYIYCIYISIIYILYIHMFFPVHVLECLTETSQDDHGLDPKRNRAATGWKSKPHPPKKVVCGSQKVCGFNYCFLFQLFLIYFKQHLQPLQLLWVRNFTYCGYIVFSHQLPRSQLG